MLTATVIDENGADGENENGDGGKDGDDARMVRTMIAMMGRTPTMVGRTTHSMPYFLSCC